MVVRLTAKLAEVVNGVDLSTYREGDILELPARDATMLLAERWAELAADASSSENPPAWRPRAIADRTATRDK